MDQTYQPLLAVHKHRKEQRSHAIVLGFALLASISSAMAGYCCGVMSGAVLFIRDNLGITEVQVEILMGSLMMASLIGSLITGIFADAIGRIRTMLLGALIVFVGCTAMGFASSYATLLIGRVITGIGIGFTYVIVPLYTAEISPPETRGMLSSFPEIFTNAGILLGYVSSFCLSGLPIVFNWRLMLLFGAIPSVVLACGMMILPESPRWLVVRNRTKEAFSVLLKTSTNTEEAELRLQDIVRAADASKKEQTPSPAQLDNVEAGDAIECVTEEAVINSWKRFIKGLTIRQYLFWPSLQVRRAFSIAFGLQFFQHASGVAGMLYYTPFIFSKAGLSGTVWGLGATVVIGAIKTVSVLVATFLLDKFGRRPLLLVSNIGMTMCLFALATCFFFVDPRFSAKPIKPSDALIASLVVGAMSAFFSFFSIGYGPICALLPSELFPLRLRARGMSLTMALNRSLSGLVSLTFLSIMTVLTPAGMFSLFAGMTVLSMMFVYLIVPETKGKILEEIR